LKIEAPTNCPSCNYELVWKNDLLFCENISCSGKEAQKIEHFAKTLKIKGLGPATIDKLGLGSITDIYQLSLDTIVDLLGSEKIAEKLYKEIERSKTLPLQEVLPAFSIPLIGKTASGKLCSVLADLRELSNAVCSEAGLGPKATTNLMDWYYDCFLQGYNLLPFSFKSDVSKPSSKCNGVVCITGKLTSVKTKGQAEKLLVEAGYTVKSSITKDVTILLNESGTESAKTKKARDMGVSVITNLKQLIEV
jgi:DNA ligase (NAD+)